MFDEPKSKGINSVTKIMIDIEIQNPKVKKQNAVPVLTYGNMKFM